MIGYPDHTFRSLNSMTRTQTVVMLWREAGSPAPTTSSGFADIPPGAWYEAAADWAAENAVVTGYPVDNTFRGNDPVKRGAFIMMLWRRGGSPAPGTLHPFTDIPSGSWLEDGVSWAAENAVVTGYPVDNTFRGSDPINRGQSVNSFNKADGLLD
jgi:UDP-N-acetylglucosamine:LPS N-acetylglucosamine transferase